MSLRDIVTSPDPRLRDLAAPVIAFDETLLALATDMAETMLNVGGIGITACHIGVLQRVVVLALPGAGGGRVFVNPIITWSDTEIGRNEEGSVSMPDVTEEVDRPVRIRFSYRDLRGNERSEEADGLFAVCMQHEIDQLDGIFWLNRLSRLKRERAIRRFEKIQRAKRET